MRTPILFKKRSIFAALAFASLSLALCSDAQAQYFADLYDDGAPSAHRGRPGHGHRDDHDGRYGHPHDGHRADPVRRPGSAFLGYMQDRALDFMDFFRLKVGFGGFGFNARATTLAQVGCVYTNGMYCGFERRAFGVWGEERFAGGIGPAYQTDIITTYYGGNEFADPTSPWNELFPRERGYIRSDVGWDDLRWRFLSVGAEVHFGVGVDVAVYPEEILDFFFGFVLIDFLQDDLHQLRDR